MAIPRETLVALMTRPLRRAHARIWIVLPILLTITFILALTARRTPTPINTGIHWEANP